MLKHSKKEEEFSLTAGCSFIIPELHKIKSIGARGASDHLLEKGLQTSDAVLSERGSPCQSRDQFLNKFKTDIRLDKWILRQG